MHAALTQTDHRPWPIPSRVWTWRQSWKDLLFAHWPVSIDVLRPLVPKGLKIQQFDGTSWVAVVPFRMTGVMRRPFPDLPGVSAFPELNVRLYVERDDKPGVWFLSLDAGNALAVWGAKRWFHLPYYFADMSMTPKGEGFDFPQNVGPHSQILRASSRHSHLVTDRYHRFLKPSLEPWNIS